MYTHVHDHTCIIPPSIIKPKTKVEQLLYLVAKLKVEVRGFGVEAQVNALSIVPYDVLCSRVDIVSLTDKVPQPVRGWASYIVCTLSSEKNGYFLQRLVAKVE